MNCIILVNHWNMNSKYLTCYGNVTIQHLTLLYSTVHSFIIDVNDNEVKTHFSEDKLDEIKNVFRLVVTPISDEVANYLKQINKKVMVNFH